MFPLFLLALLLTQSPAPDLATPAAAAFTAKCVQCHGETLTHPKSGFGLMPNLARLAAAPDYVVPGHPEDSEVWKQIESGDMPPDEARAGPLSDAERDAIFAWIKGGAPAGPPGPGAQSAPVGEPVPAAAPPEEDQGVTSARLARLIGKAHVVLVHFPIALLLAGAGRESVSMLRRERTPHATVRFCIAAGAIAAVIAAGLGWIRALDGFAGPLGNPLSIVGLHRWLGTVCAATALVALAGSELDARRGLRSPVARLAILATAAAVAAAGHFGGLLVHGRDYFSP